MQRVDTGVEKRPQTAQEISQVDKDISVRNPTIGEEVSDENSLHGSID
jgi:hypothetical protein